MSLLLACISFIKLVRAANRARELRRARACALVHDRASPLKDLQIETLQKLMSLLLALATSFYPCMLFERGMSKMLTEFSDYVLYRISFNPIQL